MEGNTGDVPVVSSARRTIRVVIELYNTIMYVYMYVCIYVYQCLTVVTLVFAVVCVGVEWNDIFT